MDKSEQFSKALNFCLDQEGRYYENVEGDSGGPTRWGITWRDYNSYMAHLGKPELEHPASLQTVPSNEFASVVVALYKLHYWQPLSCDNLVWPLNICAFDFGVNAGVSVAAKDLQGVLGVTQDGIIGVQTLGAVARYTSLRSVSALAHGFNTRRRAFYESIAHGHNAKFLKGWLNRVDNLEAFITKNS